MAMETPPANEIAHVLLMDAVASSIATMEQKRTLATQLKQAVQASPAFQRSLAQGSIISLDTGDGMALVFFGDPVTPAHCALEVFTNLNGKTPLAMRYGLHSGTVTRRIDISGRPNVTGPGIDKAHRVMNCSAGNSILLSDFFAENLGSFEEFRGLIKDRGEQSVKHGELIRVYELDASLVEPADKPQQVARVAIVYKRSAEPDGTVLRAIETTLRNAGLSVFIDQNLTIGVEWAKEIERQIRGADAVIALVSERSIRSEMMEYELELAFDERQRRQKPKILPVRIEYDQALEGSLGAMLQQVQHTVWRAEADTARVCQDILRALTEPEATPAETIESVGGVVPLDSKFYIERPADELFMDAVRRRDTIVLAKGGRQMGKTSLLARGIALAREMGIRVGVIDFQSVGSKPLESDESLYKWMAYSLGQQLGLEAKVNDVWSDWLDANTNFEEFIRNQILSNSTQPFLLALDEVDRLFTRPYGSDFFGLIRSWHNRRALEPGGPWSQLTVAIAYATEAHLFIADLNQSPFNVGTRLALEDFTIEQVSELNNRHGKPVNSADVRQLYNLIGGQPYLVRRALQILAHKQMSFPELMSRAPMDEGPFGDHLKRVLVSVSSNTKLSEATVAAVKGEGALESDGFFRLRAAGVISGESPKSARMRCELYREYLSEHLPGANGG
jgi:hypothetical protein